MHRRNAAYRKHVRRSAHIHLVALGKLQYIGETPTHYLDEPLIHDVLGPEVAASILNPLEVRHGYSARIRQDVWNYENALFVQNRVSRRGSRTVCPLADDL